MIRRRRVRPLPWVPDDGGRAAAGFRGHAGDCVTRAIAIATGLPYRQVYDGLDELARDLDGPDGIRVAGTARTGVIRAVYEQYLSGLGWAWHPVMGIGTGCRVHLRAGELPPGRIITRLSGHMAAVIDGVVHDTEDPGRAGTRCVYGYFWNPSDQEART
jgi:hypothetical protein